MRQLKQSTFIGGGDALAVAVASICAFTSRERLPTT